MSLMVLFTIKSVAFLKNSEFNNVIFALLAAQSTAYIIIHDFFEQFFGITPKSWKVAKLVCCQIILMYYQSRQVTCGQWCADSILFHRCMYNTHEGWWYSITKCFLHQWIHGFIVLPAILLHNSYWRRMRMSSSSRWWWQNMEMVLTCLNLLRWAQNSPNRLSVLCSDR